MASLPHNALRNDVSGQASLLLSPPGSMSVNRTGIVTVFQTYNVILGCCYHAGVCFIVYVYNQFGFKLLFDATERVAAVWAGAPCCGPTPSLTTTLVAYDVITAMATSTQLQTDSDRQWNP